MRCAVLGAGWAGCAAAVTLARLAHEVTVFEAAPVAGGRARRVVRNGLALDNGHHLLIGAYVQTRNLLAVVHGGDGEAGLVRSPLHLVGFARDARAIELRSAAWPGAAGLLGGLMSARGFSLRERIGLVQWFRGLTRRGFRCPPTMTVDELLAAGPAVAAERLWRPLCLAALNTPPARASAQVFANVLRDAFTGPAGSSDFLVATTDLSTLFPDAALRYVEAQGGRIALRTRARLALQDDSVGVITGEKTLAFDAAVVAVGPHQLEDALEDARGFEAAVAAARALDYEPIATVWLGYERSTPLPAPLVRLDDAPGQWVADRADVLHRADPSARASLRQLLSVVISASGPHDALSGEALAAECAAQLRRLDPRIAAPAFTQTIVERRATYACTPQRPRPGVASAHPRVTLAGDWLDGEYPATLEAAVRTGVAAAFDLDARIAPTSRRERNAVDKVG